ncbi:MAG TPA: helix-turn-helix transcriptional regulator [Kofleriaceae bacterium]
MKTRDVSQRLGVRIRTLREERELTQKQLADRVGISAAHISFIERGAKTASLEVLIGIAEVLDMSLSELFLDADNGPPQELARLSTAIAGQPIGIQRRIFHVVEEMLGAVRELKC